MDIMKNNLKKMMFFLIKMMDLVKEIIEIIWSEWNMIRPIVNATINYFKDKILLIFRLSHIKADITHTLISKDKNYKSKEGKLSYCIDKLAKY